MSPTQRSRIVAVIAAGAAVSATTATFAHSPIATANVDNISVEAPVLGAYGTGCTYKITINATQNSTIAVDDLDAGNPYGGPKTYLGASPVPYNQTVVMSWTPKHVGARLLHVSEVNTASKKDLKVSVKQGLGTGSMCLAL
ncbi:hypothetical protein HUN08_05835 [Gordonia sp. X0973]|uniref:hypothetical protein n=1 Tax=Gordonia sp. X0973 TaxID=2742602 RepID=UPI000F543F02|nr:hypothetical protein [Gordonia sp. X0973]QKT06768.1 hypothetical protein HUN08_05835 [Gordonia sp. X0973]